VVPGDGFIAALAESPPPHADAVAKAARAMSDRGSLTCLKIGFTAGLLLMHAGEICSPCFAS
jgi:hypothetical protein